MAIIVFCSSQKFRKDLLQDVLKVVDMAVCVAVLDKTSAPLKLSTNDSSRELAFHYVVHASLDVR